MPRNFILQNILRHGKCSYKIHYVIINIIDTFIIRIVAAITNCNRLQNKKETF